MTDRLTEDEIKRWRDLCSGAWWSPPMLNIDARELDRLLDEIEDRRRVEQSLKVWEKKNPDSAHLFRTFMGVARRLVDGKDGGA